MNGKSSVQELEQIASSTMDAMRGMSAGKDSPYIAALFFLKFLSDLRREQIDHPGRKSWRPAWRALKLGEGCNWEHLCHTLGQPDLAFRIDAALRTIESQNPALLEGVFRNIRFEQFSRMEAQGVRPLSKAVDILSKADFRPSSFKDPEEVGDFFERLLHLLAEREGRSGGEFYVPSALANLLTSLLNPRPGEVTLDPVCGSGILLSRVARHVGPKHGPIVGQDRRLENWSTCKMNLLFRGTPNSGIKLADPLRSPILDKSGKLMKADVVLGNPPFGWRNWEGDLLQGTRPELFRWGLNPRARSEAAFLSHMLEVARDKVGRVGIIVSLGTLVRQEEREIRRRLVEENLLVSVVSLPPKLFQTTEIPVAVLLFDKGKETDGVLFIDASQSYETSGRLNRLPDSTIDRIAKAVRSQETQPGFCRLASTEEIRALNFQLSAQLYVDQNGTEVSLKGVRELSSEIQEIERELEEVQQELDSCLRALEMENLKIT
jgi:type I restriction enzyme M protein